MTRKYGQCVGFTILAVVFALLATEIEVWARAGGGGSFGSRGFRSYSSPSRNYYRPTAPTQPRPEPQSPLAAPAPTPFGGGGFMRSMAGGLLGGFLGGMLFRSLGFAGFGGMGGGFGLMDLVILGGIGLAIYWVVKQRSQPVPTEGPYQRTGFGEREPERYQGTASQATMVQEGNLDQGIAHIRQMDPGFEEGRFREACTDLFFKVQAAWGNRDLEPIRTILTPEMYAQLGADVMRLRNERKINRLENIAVRSVELTEAWQERGQDYVTVRFLANLLDYTVDEGTSQVVDGSRTDPVKFEEYWTVTRPVGPNPWLLTAINQADN
ncbi:Tim44 domain-containing protein [Candidatus Methylomirabilis sp.]|uniref:Tim44 domain-containing protein n=1 Tax=Candidatus Methylomirabilis sp. TaxID=2032687 RepID=UPI002A5F16A9|nr:Tim44 domain-containing protein [Candidatus Methylomirabilis sp.]